jgi:hypothetical protein
MFAPDSMPDEDDVVHHQQVHRRNIDSSSMIAPDSMSEEEYIVGHRRQIMPEDSMPDYVPEDIDEETLNRRRGSVCYDWVPVRCFYREN